MKDTKKYLLGLLVILMVLACFASLSYMVETVAAPPQVKPKTTTSLNTTDLALSDLEMTATNEETLVISASQDVNLSASTLWNTWARQEGWPSWSTMLVSTRWLGDSQWKAGSRFEQVRDLGSPIGRQTLVSMVKDLTPGEIARWCQVWNGIRSCQVWSFESLGDGRTRVTNTEVFNGTPIPTIRSSVTQNWQDLFEESVAKLVAHAKTQAMP
jgi:hypothetical protein